MISLAIGAVIGVLLFACSRWRLAHLRYVDCNAKRREALEKIATLKRYLSAADANVARLTALQQPRLPNGRFKGKANG